MGSPGFSAALALLVVSRRTRVSGKCLRRKCPAGECSFQGGQCPFPGVLVWPTEIVDGRLCASHLRRSSASWLKAQSLFHTGHCVEKLFGLNKQKLVVMATSRERSEPNFTTIIYARKVTSPENWAKIGRALSEIIGLEPVVKTGRSFGS